MSESQTPPQPYFLLNGFQVFKLTQPETKIGRGGDCDLTLTDLRVSRQHAKFSQTNNAYILADLNSSGGTFVNGRPIVQKLLQPGDVITLASSVRIIFDVNPDNLPPNVEAYQPKFTETGQIIQTGILDPSDLAKNQ